MTDIPLDAFVRRISTAAEHLFMKNDFTLSPVFIGQRANGEPVTIAIDIANKDETAALMRAIAAEFELVRCAYVDEAWTANLSADAPAVNLQIAIMNRIGVKAHPDRREAVIIGAEDYVSGQMMGFRYILRPEHGKPSLSPLTIERGGRLEGRFVGILPPRGVKQ
jgi:hypothetical protein